MCDIKNKVSDMDHTIQWVIVGLIIAICIILIMHRIFNSFFSKKKSTSLCDSCSGCNLRKEMNIRQKECTENKEAQKRHVENSKTDN